MASKQKSYPSYEVVPFSTATQVKPISSHVYSGQFHVSWCIGSVPHGGITTSLIHSAVRTHFATTLSKLNQPDTLNTHLQFLRRTEIGPAQITIKDVKLGSRISVVHVTLEQAGRVAVMGYIIQSNIKAESGITFPVPWKLIPSAPPIDFQRVVAGTDEHWVKFNYSPAVLDFRKALARTEWFMRREALRKDVKREPTVSTDTWLRWSDGSKFTNASLGSVVDYPNQPIIQYKESDLAEPLEKGTKWGVFWYPTLLLDIEFRKLLPDEGVEWLYLKTETQRIKNGRMDVTVTVLDTLGEIIAVGHQVALVLSAARNTAARSNKDGEKSKM